MLESESVNVFGKFLIENLRDVIIGEVEANISGQSMDLNSYKMTKKLEKFNEEYLCIIRELIVKLVDFALSEFLYSGS